MHYIIFHIKTLKIAPTCFDPEIILRELRCSLLKSCVHDAHHSQTHSQQRTLTQHDMLPQHPVNIKELFCEFFKMTLARNNVAP